MRPLPCLALLALATPALAEPVQDSRAAAERATIARTGWRLVDDDARAFLPPPAPHIWSAGQDLGRGDTALRLERAGAPRLTERRMLREALRFGAGGRVSLPLFSRPLPRF